MSDEPFVDYYEVLQVSPNADRETIERVFRHLAKRYHPDNTSGGDRERFDALMTAYKVLDDPAQRAAYDVRQKQRAALRVQLAEEACGDSYAGDHTLRARLLSLLYVQRRREPHRPGLGNLELAQTLGCPYEFLDFHLWYMRQKKWIELTENGMVAITADGVDRVEEDRVLLRRDRLISEEATPAADQPRPQLEGHHPPR